MKEKKIYIVCISTDLVVPYNLQGQEKMHEYIFKTYDSHYTCFKDAYARCFILSKVYNLSEIIFIVEVYMEKHIPIKKYIKMKPKELLPEGKRHVVKITTYKPFCEKWLLIDLRNT